MAPEGEKTELADIYVSRGLEPKLARQIAEQLMAKDALLAHTRDELGFSDAASPRPVQAAFSSAVAFGAGAFLSLLSAFFASGSNLIVIIGITTLIVLSALGALAGYVGRSQNEV